MTDAADRLYMSLLVLRCQAGDRAAFEELIAFYQPRLHYYLQKMLRPRQSVDDLLQEVWLEVYRTLARLANPSAFPAWLYRIARHRVFRELRKRRPAPRSLAGIDVAAVEEPDDFSAEDAERVHAALDQLDHEHREVLLLRFIEEMTYDEIAGVLNCPVGTVRSRIHYAKRTLRRALERTSLHE
jgi:RNA polymerase sigma-70 factor (ECF subfamily)